MRPLIALLLLLALVTTACRTAGTPPAGDATTPTGGGPAPATAPPDSVPAAGAPTPGARTPSAGTPVPVAAGATAAPAATDLPDRVITLRVGERDWTARLRELGFRPGAAGGLEVVAGGRLDELLADIASQVDQPARDARLRIHGDGRVEYTSAVMGVALDVAAARARIGQAVVQGADRVDLATKQVPPARGDEAFAAAREQLGRVLPPGEGALVTMRAAERTWEFDRGEVAAMLAFEGHDRPGARVQVVLEEAPVRELLKRIARAVDQEPQNARFDWNGGNPKLIREGKPGRALDQEAAYERLRRGLLGAERGIDLPVAPKPPGVPNDPKVLGAVELIERGSTPLAGAIPEKKQNVKLAAERLNGVVVPPGGTFSFNHEVGPTTLESGFKWGFAITSGADGIRTVPSVAGGICQVATTLFQPVFWAGYMLEERYWHLYWIPAYTSRDVIGLDVTVDEASGLDFKWTNPTDSHVLVQAAADEGKVTFALYGKKPKWTVKVTPSKITNRVPPDTKPVYEEEPSMPWGRTIVVEAAREGFDVELSRTVVPADGSEPRVLTLKSSYQPSRNVTLVGTGGKPAGASVEDAVAKPSRPSAPAATPAGPGATPAAPGATPTVARAGATPSGANRPAPTPATKPAESGAKPVPTPIPTVTPARPAPATTKPGRRR
ncbi:MAG TPA: VanW family protein [Chloroflexota bacterium]